MNIVFDIGHPGHVHFFRNSIKEMKNRGHNALITATRKDVTSELLDGYGFDYVDMGSYGKSIVSKFLNIPVMDIKMLKAVRRFKPDMFVGIGSIRGAHISRLLGKPSITFDDSEPSPIEHMLYKSFTDVILTPLCFRKDFGRKQVRYDGYHEIAYLHPDYFKPDPSVLAEVGLKQDEKYIIIRFVAWQAGHDFSRHGIDLQGKRKLVNELEKFGRVLITSENPLPDEFEKNRIPVSPNKIFDLLYYATLFFGDSQTMTTEAGILGTPAIRCNSWVGPNDMGNFLELENKYDLIYSFREPDRAIQKAVELLQQSDLKKQWAEKKRILFKGKIDVTRFIQEFIENYPDSYREYRTGTRAG